MHFDMFKMRYRYSFFMPSPFLNSNIFSDFSHKRVKTSILKRESLRSFKNEESLENKLKVKAPNDSFA